MEYFDRGQTGLDANPGTSAALAKKTLAACAAIPLGVADVLNIAEWQDLPAGVTFAAASLLLRREAGQAMARAYGLTRPLTWEATGVRSWRAPCTAAAIRGVVDRYDSRVFSEDRHGGWQRAEVSAAAVDALTTGLGTYFLDTGGQYVYTQLSDGADPNALTGEDRVGWLEDFATAVDCGGGGVTIEDLEIRGWGSTGASYGIQVDNGNNIVRRCTTRDTGIHGLAVLGANGTDVVEDCDFHGARINSATPLVFFTSTGNAGGRIRQCRFYPYAPLDASGVPIDTAITIDPFVSHTDGLGGHVVDDLKISDSDIYWYENKGNPWIINNSGPAPVTRTDHAAYPLEVIRSRSRRGWAAVWNQASAFVNCYFDFTRAPGSTYPYTIFYNGASVIAFFGSVLVFDQDHASVNKFMNLLSSGTELHFYNCTLVDRGVAATGLHQFFVTVSTTFKLVVHHSVLRLAANGAANTRLLGGDTGASAANLDFVGNWYSGIKSTGYGEDSSRNTEAKWLDPSTGVDRTGVAQDPLLEDEMSIDPLVAGKPSAGSPLLLPSNKVIVPGILERGINGRPYDGTPGAWQFGATRGGGLSVGVNVGV